MAMNWQEKLAGGTVSNNSGGNSQNQQAAPSWQDKLSGGVYQVDPVIAQQQADFDFYEQLYSNYRRNAPMNEAQKAADAAHSALDAARQDKGIGAWWNRTWGGIKEGAKTLLDNANNPDDYSGWATDPLSAANMGLGDNYYGLGNINLYDRNTGLYDEDGNLMTVRSMSFFDDKEGKEILVPTIVKKDGVWTELTNDEAEDWYYKTGEYLGKFDTVEQANAYANRLHEQQAAMYVGNGTQQEEEPKPDMGQLYGAAQAADAALAQRADWERWIDAAMQYGSYDAMISGTQAAIDKATAEGKTEDAKRLQGDLDFYRNYHDSMERNQRYGDVTRNWYAQHGYGEDAWKLAEEQYQAAKEEYRNAVKPGEVKPGDVENDPQYKARLDEIEATLPEALWDQYKYWARQEAEERVYAAAGQAQQDPERIQAAARALEEAQWILGYAATQRYADLPQREGFLDGAAEGEAKFEMDREGRVDATYTGNMEQAREDAEAMADYLGYAEGSQKREDYINRYLAEQEAYQQGEYQERAANASKWDPTYHTEYREPDERWTEEQRNIFHYLYNEDPDRAATYAIGVNEQYNADEAAERDLRAQEYATRNGFTGALATIGAIGSQIVAGGIDTMSMMAENAYRGDITESNYTGLTRWADASVSAVAQELNSHGNLNDLTGGNIWLIGDKGLGDVYQLFVSMAQSGGAIALSGGNGAVVNMMFFGSAAASETRAALDRGLSGDQAILTGLCAGAAEAIGESLSIENLMSNQGLADFLLKGPIREMFKQGGVEMSEEMFTTFLNNVSDAIINGDDSAFNAKVTALIMNGMDPEEAQKTARKEQLEGYLNDGLMGMLSGVGMSGFHYAGYAIPAAGTQFQGDTQSLTDASVYAGEGSRAYEYGQRIQGLIDKGKNISNYAADKLSALLSQKHGAGSSAAMDTILDFVRGFAPQESNTGAPGGASLAGENVDVADGGDRAAMDEYTRRMQEQQAGQTGTTATGPSLAGENQAVTDSGTGATASAQEAAAQEPTAQEPTARNTSGEERAERREQEDQQRRDEAAASERETADISDEADAAAEEGQEKTGENQHRSEQKAEDLTEEQKENAAALETVTKLLDGLENGGELPDGMSREEAEKRVNQLETDLRNRLGIAGNSDSTGLKSTGGGRSWLRSVINALGREQGRWNKAEARLRYAKEELERDRKLNGVEAREAKSLTLGGETGTIMEASYSADSGKTTLTVDLGDGRIQQVDSEKMTGPAKEFYDTLTSLLGREHAAQAFNEFRDGQRTIDYAVSFANVRELGRASKNSAAENAAGIQRYQGNLTKEQAELAYTLGQGMGRRQAAQRTRSIRGKGRISLDGGMLDGQRLDAVHDQEALRNSEDFKAVQAIAKALGIDVVFYESRTDDQKNFVGAQGSYWDGRVWLDVNAGRNNVNDHLERMLFTTFSHELTHFIRENAATQYQALEDRVVEYLRQHSGQTMDALIKQKIARSSVRLDFDTALEEVIADSCETMLRDSEAVRQLAKKTPGLFDQIRDFMRDWFDRILAGHDEAKIIQPQMAELQKLWDAALIEAVESRVSEETLENLPGAAEIVEATEDAAEEERVRFSPELLREIIERERAAGVRNERLERLYRQTAAARHADLRYGTQARLALPAHTETAQEQAAQEKRETGKKQKKAKLTEEEKKARAADRRRFKAAVDELMEDMDLDGTEISREEAEQMVLDYAATHDGYYSVRDEIRAAKAEGRWKSDDQVRADYYDRKRAGFDERQELSDLEEWFSGLRPGENGGWVTANGQTVSERELDRKSRRMMELQDSLGMDGSKNSDRETVTEAQEKEAAENDFAGDGSESRNRVYYSQREKDPEVLRFLNEQVERGDVVVTYKTFLEVVEDGQVYLYPPMAAMQRDDSGKKRMANAMAVGEWEKSVGNPNSRNIISKVNSKGETKWYYRLEKEDGGTPVDAAYDPYQHSSNVVLNDQFEAAYQRPRLATYECIIPKSEVTSGYQYREARADGQIVEAALPVGQHPWKKGTVASHLKNTDRMVYLSRWLMPTRRLENSEVARMYKEILDREDHEVSIPFNVVPPGLLTELEKAGVPIDYEGSPMYKAAQRRKAEKTAPKSGEVIKFSAREEVRKMDIPWDPDNNSTIKTQLNRERARLLKKPPVISLTYNSGEDYLQRLDKVLRERFGYKINRQDGISFLFDKGAIGILDHYIHTDTERAAAIAAPFVLKRGEIISGHKYHKGGLYPSLTFAAPVEINGKKGAEAVTVLFGDKDRAHALRIVDENGREFELPLIKEEATPSLVDVGVKAPLALPISVAPADTLTQNAAEVKKSDREGNIAPAKFEMREPVETTDRLVALHNKSVSGLRRMLQRGGVPFPSIAIKQAGTPHEGFGDVTIVFPRSTIDPAESRWNRLYSNDAWTPTEPRTEYEVDETWKLQQQMEMEIGTDIYRATKLGSYLEKNQLERDLGYSDGDIVKALKGRTGIKYAYLKSIGQEPTAALTEKPLDGFGRYKNAQLLAVFEAVPASELKAMDYDSQETLQKIADALNRQFLEQFPSDASKQKFSRHPIYSAEKINPQIIKDALRNYENNGRQIESQIDDVALEKALRDNKAIEDDAQYQEWIRNRFGGLIKDSGIPNGKGVYTDSGNRRSFKARHVPATLENIVQQMRKEQETGIGLGGINLRGAATKAYSSVEEMRAESGKLLGERVFDEEYDSYMREFGQMLNDLTETADKVGYDTAKEILLEAIRDSKSKVGMQKQLQRNSRWINYSVELLDELWQLRNDVQNMPAPYFEAKPRRVVSTEEALAYIVPDNVDSDVLQMLQDRGMNVLTYEAGNSQDRLDKVNSVEGARFSERDDARTDREMLLDELMDSEAGLTDAEKKALAGYRQTAEKVRQQEDKVKAALAELDRLVKAGADKELINKQRQRVSNLQATLQKSLRELTMAETRDKTMLEIIRKEREIQRRRTAMRTRETFTRRELRGRITKLYNDLNRRALHPGKERHIPASVMLQAVQVLEAINMDTTKEGSQRGQKLRDKLLELQNGYRNLQNDPDFQAAAAYDPVVAELLDNMITAVGDTPINRMSVAQLQTVYDTIKALDKTAREALLVRMLGEERDAYQLAMEMAKETRRVNGDKKSLLSQYLNAQLSAERMFRRLGNYQKDSAWEQVYRMLNDGQLTATRIQIEGSAIFEELMTGKDYDRFVNPRETVDVGLKDADGNAVLITHGMMVSLYMHLLNAQNRRHIAYGGVTVPNLRDYYNGRRNRGIDSSVHAVGVSQEIGDLRDQLRNEQDEGRREELQLQIQEAANRADVYAADLQAAIEGKLTDYDRQWIAAARELFDGFSKEKLNATTMEVYGIKRANVDNYFPIWVDGDFLQTPFESIAKDMSLENAGFMKERVDSGKPVRLADVGDVSASQLRRVSQYCGLMPVTRSFQKIWGKTQTGYRESLQSAVRQKFGQGGINYIEHLMADLNGARGQQDGPLGEFFNRVRGNMAQASLTLSARVAMGQTASYPTAAAVVGWKALGKALAKGGRSGRVLSRADQELIRKYSPLLAYRMKGFSSVELGDLAGSNSRSARIWKKMRWATGWIQFMDGATVGRLWYAAEYYVQDHRSDLRKGTDEYYRAVAEVFNAVVEKTQPDYTTMQRPDILRNPNALVKQMTMFLTQRLQNFNILYDAAATYSQRRQDLKNGVEGVTIQDVRAAGQDVTRAVTSQLAAAATITAFKFLADAIFHSLKGYRDDDEELTEESVSMELLDMFADSLAGNVLLGGELYDIIESRLFGKTYYGIEVSGVSTVTDVIDSANKALDAALAEGATWQSFWNKGGHKLAKNISTLFGLPLANAEKILQGMYYHAVDIKNGEFLSYEAGVERSTAQQANRLLRAYREANFGQAKKIREAVGDDEALNKALTTAIKRDFAEGKINRVQAQNQLSRYASKDAKTAEKTMREYACEVETGIKFSQIDEKLLDGTITEARAAQLWQKYGGKSLEDAKSKAAWTVYQDRYPDTTLTSERYQTYEAKYAQYMSAREYERYLENMNACKGTDLDGNGKTDSGSVKSQKLAVIDAMDLTVAEKDALYRLNGWSESTLKDAPWH